MRLSTSLLITALALVESVCSASIPALDTSRPDPLPPDSYEGEHAFMARAIAADNITVPLPPSNTPSSPPSPVPTPMDLSVSYALSDSCLLYLTSVLSSSTFKSCLPFSLLLTTSTSYASLLSDALSSGNLSTINSLLAYTSSPQPSSDTCDEYFSGVLSAFKSKSNCAADLAKGSATVTTAKQAHVGFGNYKIMREAAMITDPDTGKYCYLQAIAATTPDDLYLWSIPAGVSLPSRSTPTCSKCSSLLLNHYGQSLNQTSTLNGTILESAVNIVNNQCGVAFATYSAATRSAASPSLGIQWKTAGLGVMLTILAVYGVS